MNRSIPESAIQSPHGIASRRGGEKTRFEPAEGLSCGRRCADVTGVHRSRNSSIGQQDLGDKRHSLVSPKSFSLWGDFFCQPGAGPPMGGGTASPPPPQRPPRQAGGVDPPTPLLGLAADVITMASTLPRVGHGPSRLRRSARQRALRVANGMSVLRVGDIFDFLGENLRDSRLAAAKSTDGAEG